MNNMEREFEEGGGSGEGGDGKRESWRMFGGERTNIKDILKRNIDGYSD